MKEPTVSPHPLWKKFNRPFWVVSLSEPEHKLRDAIALIRLRDFLLRPGLPQVTFAKVTLGPKGPSEWPPVPEHAGLVVLGRPSLFGQGLTTLLETADPPVAFRFVSDRPSPPKPYRAIKCDWDGRTIPGPLFSELRKRKHPLLTDNAIAYSGWQAGRPLMILAGSSTVGTWGAAQFVTEPPPAGDIRWNGDVQGVVAASVRNTHLAFDKIERLEQPCVRAPFELRFEGSGLPWKNNWTDLRLGRGRKGGFDVRMEVNGCELAAGATSHLPLLIVLAWFSPKHAAKRLSGYVCEAECSEITNRIFRFLWDEAGEVARQVLKDLACASPSALKEAFRHSIAADLESMTDQIRQAGGIAFRQGGPAGLMRGGSARRYTAILRELPTRCLV